MTIELPASKTVSTSLGDVEYKDSGDGFPILMVHGSPGGGDQAALMAGFLVDRGFRVIAPFRPGYLGTPLTEANSTPVAQAQLHIALLDALGVERCGVMCWSGGGPSSYLLAADNADRVTALVALAAASHKLELEVGADERFMMGKVGGWMLKEMGKHATKSLISSTLNAEGELSKDQLKALTQEVFDDQTKRDFVVAFPATIVGRKVGLDNDIKQLAAIDDLGLDRIKCPTLLVHGAVDTDVEPEASDHAHQRIAGSELTTIDLGTHLAVWTATDAEAIQTQIASFFNAHVH